MGCFLSKKDSSSTTVVIPSKAPDSDVNISKLEVEIEVNKKKIAAQENQQHQEKEGVVNKEVFVVKHRKSYDRDRPQKLLTDGVATTNVSTNSANTSSTNEPVTEISKSGAGTKANVVIDGINATPVVVRTSSCTKEEVDAILIQCGRLSRSSSGRAASNSASCERSRKYSGSKRSFDFDNDAVAAGDDDKRNGKAVYDEEDAMVAERSRQRHGRRSRASPQGRRRTPSRERDQQQQHHQRSNSAERASGGSSGRRVSRSPGKRSETPNTANGGSANYRPGKMVSVPPTVSSMAMDKSNNGGPAATDPAGTTTAIKRILVKRNAGEAAVVAAPRGASSPRSRSPARVNANAKGSGENQQASLSRSSSRKAEHSPYRRNPLGEIDTNSLAYTQPQGHKPIVKNKIEDVTLLKEPSIVMNQVAIQKPNGEIKEVVAQGNAQKGSSNITATATESLKPQGLTRSRSSRRSQDLDFNPEVLMNQNNAYNSLLLEDIQSFHQKNITSFSLPACVSKVCSIMEAVADLNSTTSSNVSCTFSEDRRRATTTDQMKKRAEVKDPFVESEVTVSDDLMEPSLHKYVTVRRGGMEDMDGQESSGSNSIAGSLQNWGLSSSSWEPNSADSRDCWTSRSNTREENHTPLSQRCTASEPQRTGIGRNRIGASRGGSQAIPIVATAASS